MGYWEIKSIRASRYDANDETGNKRDEGDIIMETTGKNFKSVLVLILAAFIMVAVVPGFKAEARAGAGAFLGGIIWSNFGLLPVCLISGFCTFAALISVFIGFYPFIRINPENHL